MPEQTPLEARIKIISFDPQKTVLVDETGVEYGGRRFGSPITVKSTGGWEQDTRRQALQKLENLAQDAGADAYEICSLQTFFIPAAGSHDPCYGYATAILYKRA